MAEVSDPALAPIGTVQRTRIGREATEPMRQDIRLLGGILSDTIREQNGEQVFDLGPPGSAGTALSEPSLPSRQTCGADYLFLDGSHFKYHANASAEPVLAALPAESVQRIGTSQ